MYAVVNIAGHQVKVDKGQRLRVPRLQVEEGSTQEFTDVLATRSSSSKRRNAKNTVGAPAIVRTILRFRSRTSFSRTKRERTKYHGS